MLEFGKQYNSCHVINVNQMYMLLSNSFFFRTTGFLDFVQHKNSKY
jgi:hypothetical protein